MGNRLVVQEDEGSVRVSLQCPGRIAPEAACLAEPFESPWTPRDTEDLRWYLESYLSLPFAVYKDRGAAIQRQVPVWGEKLFASLFGRGRSGRDAYLRARTLGSWELWIASSSTSFLSLPWELLKDPQDSSPLALSPVGIHRTIPLASPPPKLYPGDCLRVLMVVARPKGVEDVGYRTVARPLLKRLDLVSGRVDFEVLRPPTFEAFRAKLRSASRDGAPFHVVHFDVHGWFWPETPPAGIAAMQGAVQFETEVGDGDVVPVERLAPFLAEVQVPLIVLNSCRSAMLPDGTPVDAALATRLLSEGKASSVVAMSHTIYAVSAAELTSAFYEALFEKRTVAEAVTRARLQLRVNPLRPSAMGNLPLEDWMVPVHYARRELSFPDLVRQPEDRPPLEDRLAARLTRSQPPPVPGSEGSIEEDGSVFFSRDREILHVERALRLRRVVLLHGPAGIGTSELAKAFARWLRISGGLDRPDGAHVHSFAPGIASFALDGALLSAGTRVFGKRFGRLRKEERRERLLAALREERLLLIWDNFESAFSLHDPEGGTPRLAEAERAEIVSFLGEVAKEARGGLILTSRNPERWLGEDVHRIEIQGLDGVGAYEHAEYLLRSLETARARRRHPAYAELLEILGGHPLAMRLILPRLERDPPEDLILALRGEQPLRPEGEKAFDALDSCIRSSLRHLGPEHTERLFVLSLFEGAVDVRVLAGLSRAAEGPARFRGIPKTAWRQTLNEAVYAGLLTVLSPDLYRIQPALPAFLADLWRRRAGSGWEDERTAARTARVKAQARFAVELFRKSAVGDTDVVMGWLDVAHRSLGGTAADALRLGRFREAQKIVQLLNFYWSHRDRRGEAAAWLARCRAAAEGETGRVPRLSTPRRALWLFAVLSQASQLLRERRLREAEEELHRMAEALAGATDPESHRRLSGAFFHLGRVALEQGELDEAERWFRKTLELKKSVEDQRGIASLQLHFGRIALERGEMEKAERQLDRARRMIESLGSPDLLQLHFQLAALDQAQGRLDEAEAGFEKAWEIARDLTNSTWQANCVLRLGVLDQMQGRWDLAKARLEQAMKVHERRRDDSGRAESYRALGRLAFQCGNIQESMDWMVHAAVLFDEIASPKLHEAVRDLAGPVAQLGIAVLEESWRLCTGTPLPESIRKAVADRAA